MNVDKIDKSLPLITKYRPEELEDVVGHQEVMRALKRALNSKSPPRAFLALGPSGLGKTTIARIIGRVVNAQITEIDAASQSGVEAMRALVQSASHMSLAGAGRRMYIIDECHALTKLAWQPILKLLEEPPSHLYIALCTTEAHKVPETIKTRCYPIELRPLRISEMEELLTAVAAAENWDVLPEAMTAILQAAQGSPRRGLSMLDAVHGAESTDEVRRIITLQDAGDPVIKVARFLLERKQDWESFRKLLQMLEEEFSDDVIPQISSYIVRTMINAKDEKTARRAWEILEALTFPVNSYDPKVILHTAIGKLMWGG